MKVLDITNITATVARYKGIAKPSLFVVSITPPQSLINDSVVQDLKFLGSTSNLPGITFSTDDYKPKGYGLSELRVTNVIQDDVAVNFFIDNQGAVQNFFHKWGQKQFNFDHTNIKSTSQGTPLEGFAYPADIWGVIDLTHYAQDGTPILTYNLSKVIIKSIGTVQMGWEMNDQIAFLPITFGFKSWSTKGTASNDVKYNSSLDVMANQRSALATFQSGTDPAASGFDNFLSQIGIPTTS